MKFVFSIVGFLFVCNIIAQDKKAYQFFDSKGKRVTYEKVLKASEKTDVVLFGEYHDNSLVHWLQLEFTKDLAKRKNLVLGAEMLEADNQEVVNRYLKGAINQKGLDTLARLWINYITDYKPLVDFAKSKQIDFIATNIPRRYASLVFRKDLVALDSLTSQEKAWIAPLPIAFDINLPGYKSMMGMQGGHAGEKMPKAQAIKDATMAYFINKNRKENSVFIHYNGTYHSDNYEGINWYLKKLDDNIKIITIAMVEQKDLGKLESENYNKANFILVIDEDVTRSY
ncbi:ChaN family lipoprotein [Flavobacterium tibetense]|uniref:Iron-regulated protein n=1 Tax=Flavobacterium tibetense TaxID=2233533 RepID=A0A365P3C0_9FLAO|nr:ChaN family lipoprotein [Flavobacterium tibetense]RBA29049.1 iron-regulated protein [Flavobacterium tibetense]